MGSPRRRHSILRKWIVTVQDTVSNSYARGAACGIQVRPVPTPKLFWHAANSKFCTFGVHMDNFYLPEQVEKELKIFAKKNQIEKIILFGSRAKGCHTERSDVDIAVSGGEFDHFYSDVQDKINSLLMFDIINMDEKMSDELRGEIERYGLVIYEKN